MSEAAATPSKHVDADAKEAWVLTQKKTFTKWFNNHLKKKGFSALDDAEVDFESGIKIIQITSALYGLPIPKHNANPKLRPHKLDNIQIGLNMLEEAKVKTNFLKSSHFVDHDVKMILGFMWAVILDYAIKGISEDDTTAKEGLLLWCRKKTAGYREIDPPTILNFTGHWRNGLAFCALIHKHQPGLIDYDSLDASNAASNLELAFSVAESLGIPRLLDVEDVNVEKPDERSIMTQVSEYFHRFSAQSEKEVAARRAAKFLAFARETVALEQDYESGARELLAWVQSTIERFQAEQSASSMEEAVAAVEQLRTFVLEEKPKKSAAKLDLESKYAEIQQRLRVNGRTQWECPAELTPQSIDAAFDAQFNAEKIYATAAREKRFAFIHKEEATVSESDLQEMRDSYKHFDHDKDGAMDKTEFKAALSAMGVPVKDDAVLATLFTKVTNGAAAVTLEQWIAYLSELRTDKDTPEQITDAFRTLADGRSTVSVEGLRVPPLSESDVAYLSENIPRAEDGGLDYAAFVAREFAQRE